jgi:hypothetical protein
MLGGVDRGSEGEQWSESSWRLVSEAPQEPETMNDEAICLSLSLGHGLRGTKSVLGSMNNDIFRHLLQVVVDDRMKDRLNAGFATPPQSPLQATRAVPPNLERPKRKLESRTKATLVASPGIRRGGIWETPCQDCDLPLRAFDFGDSAAGPFFAQFPRKFPRKLPPSSDSTAQPQLSVANAVAQ